MHEIGFRVPAMEPVEVLQMFVETMGNLEQLTRLG
jgi:hypothetical protein